MGGGLSERVGIRRVVALGPVLNRRLGAVLVSRGFQFIHVPLFRLAARVGEDGLGGDIEWATALIITSKETVRWVKPWVNLLQGRRVYAVGPTTARELERVGVSCVVAPPPYSFESVVGHMPVGLEGERLLIPGSEWADTRLDGELLERGALLRRTSVYCPIPTGFPLPHVTWGDVVVVSSPAQARVLGVVDARVVAVGEKAHMARPGSQYVAVGDEEGLLGVILTPP